MNTAALKRFAQQARVILIEGVRARLVYWGFDTKGNMAERPVNGDGGVFFRGEGIDDPTLYKKWTALEKAIKTHGVAHVVEEAAYTWFNRLMAIRILAKNGYIPPQLEFESDLLQVPMIVGNARRGQIPRLTLEERNQLEILLKDDSAETRQFSLLITAFCRTNKLLHRLFGRLDDYTEMLLPQNILSENGFIMLLNNNGFISTKDYRQVELIGWLYQFYISERKDEVFKGFKNKKKAEAEDIPAATQIFTPNWIVKYMVQNTVGRLWLDLNPESPIQSDMTYLVENPDAADSDPLISEVAEIKLLDPACGSGHILVEGFDLLFAMYTEEGYSKREATREILRRNLYGLDIDLRAAQLANFALLLKAASKDPAILDEEITPQVYAMPESYEFSDECVRTFLGEETRYAKTLQEALALMRQSQNLGSVMKIDLTPDMRVCLQTQLAYWEKRLSTINLLFLKEEFDYLLPYIRIILLLTQQYEAVAANPPYMGSGNMNTELKEYVNKNYPEGKSDLMTVFMKLGLSHCQKNGFMSMINLPSWMFLSSYELLRKELLDNITINSLLHLGRGVFGSDFGSVVFTFQNISKDIQVGVYRKLFEQHVQVRAVETIRSFFLNKSYGYHIFHQSNFEKIPGSPIAYWVSEKMIECFMLNNINDISNVKKGLSTGDVSLFMRFWFEANIENIDFNCNDVTKSAISGKKWFPYMKGGAYRKWYGNHEYIVNWENDGQKIKNFADENGKLRSRPQNIRYYFNEGITYSALTSYKYSVRYMSHSIFGGGGDAILCNKKEQLISTIALLNSIISDVFLKIISPTLNYEVSHILSIPIKFENTLVIENKSQQNISISRLDWDSRETSWDFQENEIIKQQKSTIDETYRSYLQFWTGQFAQLHANEVELNRIFIDIYGLQDELTPEVKLKDITILQEELDYNVLGELTEMEQLPDPSILPLKSDEVMRQFISYAIGCAMGRYRLDRPGLHIAHPKPSEEELASYAYNHETFQIDEDAIIPLMDASCGFADNALVRVKALIRQVWGMDAEIENINFLESSLGKDLEGYLVKDFWKDHCRRYQKRPVYWLFSSPKGAFQVLVYMHRMSKYTVEKIRSNYLLKHIHNLTARLELLEKTSATLDRREQRELTKIAADLEECRAYELLLKNVADHQIEFDLDDGVVVNYTKFEGVVGRIK